MSNLWWFLSLCWIRLIMTCRSFTYLRFHKFSQNGNIYTLLCPWCCYIFIVFILFFILQEIVAMLSLKPGQKVLDVGCGIGGSGFYMVKVWLDPFFLSLVEKAGSIRVQSIELSQSCHAICQIVLCATFFLGLLSSFFLWIESEISEQVRWQVATEEPNKGFWTCQVPYVMLS